MILVAGLAIAGLAGIAAAFYFSMRPGGSRVRPETNRAEASRDGASRAGVSRAGAGRSRTSPPPSGRSGEFRSGEFRSGGSRSGRAVDRTGPQTTVIDFTGPQRVLEDPEPPVTVGNRPGNRPGNRQSRPAARVTEADTDDAAQEPRSRRRVGWRKGSDVDEELWPAETFGGVSDEQFWDDMAADKPLATTARTAQPEAAARRRRGPLPDLHPGNGRGPGGRVDGRGASASPESAGTNPQPRLGADDRTAIQPAVQPSAASPRTPPLATQPYPVVTPPSPAATQPVRATHQPAEPRGRSRTAPSADEDPLTSPAYSLRGKGPVDGRSSGGYPVAAPPVRQFDRPAHGPNGQGRPDPLRPDPLRPDPLRSDALRPDPLRPADPYAAYPYVPQPYGEPPTQSMNTPPYGGRYGPENPGGSRAQAGPAGDPRRANGGWIPGQADGRGAGDRNASPRPASPPVNGHRGPYDPRGYDRRLTGTH
jgi:hypothetical protein